MREPLWKIKQQNKLSVQISPKNQSKVFDFILKCKWEDGNCWDFDIFYEWNSVAMNFEMKWLFTLYKQNLNDFSWAGLDLHMI